MPNNQGPSQLALFARAVDTGGRPTPEFTQYLLSLQRMVEKLTGVDFADFATVDDLNDYAKTSALNDYAKRAGTIVDPYPLGASTDLNGVHVLGVYNQELNANASSALNYPVNRAGALFVMKASNLGAFSAGLIQVYLEYRSSNRFQRGSSDGTTWTSWG